MSIEIDLSGRVAFVTGGSRGLGRMDALTLRPTRTPDWLVAAIEAAESAAG